MFVFNTLLLYFCILCHLDISVCQVQINTWYTQTWYLYDVNVYITQFFNVSSKAKMVSARISSNHSRHIYSTLLDVIKRFVLVELPVNIDA